jgi:putative addiction module CopG family antidote
MTGRISDENEQFIQRALESGTYRSRDELIDQAATLLKRRVDLKREIQAGIESGPSISEDEVFAILRAQIEKSTP